MRLLDQIAHSTAPFLVRQNDGALWRLTGACDFAAPLRSCPLRYVLTDELTRMCAALAYSDGAQLSDCLDLLHVPAQRLWIEWNHAPLRDELLRARPDCRLSGGGADVMRTGALIEAAPGGRSGVLRTLWVSSTAADDPLVAPLATVFDFDRPRPPAGNAQALLQGECIGIDDGDQHALDDVLHCVQYRFDETWLRYYQQQQPSADTRALLLRLSLATVAYDLPLVLALLLLQAARGGLPQRPCDVARLNLKRQRSAKPPLLAHVELAAPVFSDSAWPHASDADALRQAPRRHHVRGHLVRRHDVVYWRSPHWRGHLRLGHIERRTVSLSSGAAFARGP